MADIKYMRPDWMPDSASLVEIFERVDALRDEKVREAALEALKLALNPPLMLREPGEVGPGEVKIHD